MSYIPMNEDEIKENIEITLSERKNTGEVFGKIYGVSICSHAIDEHTKITEFIPLQKLPPLKFLGKRLRKMREDAGWSMKMLADEIGVSYQTISNWECGRALPSLLNIFNLQDAYGDCDDLVYFLGIEGEKSEVIEGYKQDIDMCIPEKVRLVNELLKNDLKAPSLAGLLEHRLDNFCRYFCKYVDYDDCEWINKGGICPLEMK